MRKTKATLCVCGKYQRVRSLSGLMLSAGVRIVLCSASLLGSMILMSCQPPGEPLRFAEGTGKGQGLYKSTLLDGQCHVLVSGISEIRSKVNWYGVWLTVQVEYRDLPNKLVFDPDSIGLIFRYRPVPEQRRSFYPERTIEKDGLFGVTLSYRMGIFNEGEDHSQPIDPSLLIVLDGFIRYGDSVLVMDTIRAVDKNLTKERLRDMR